MANPTMCSINECGNPVEARGWCNSHYRRWRRNGDPESGRTPEGDLAKFFNEVVLHHQGDDCLIWPYGRSNSGYGMMTLNGKQGYVHRFVCTAIDGPPPFEDAEAAHSCGNGHLACVSRHHLRWATSLENHADKIIHGTTNRGEKHWKTKLTKNDVLKIRSLEGVIPRHEMACQFNISLQTICDIIRRKNWSHI